jgi:glycosyltransferase 2 family protein
LKKHLITVIKISVTVVILYLIFRRFEIGLDDIAAAFTHHPEWFIASFLAQVGAIIFSIARWNVLLKGQDLNVPFPHIVKTYMVGRFLGTFTPTGIGLEAYKAWDIARYTGKTEASVSVVLIEKMVATFFAMSLWAMVTLPFFIGMLNVKFLIAFGLFFGVLLVLSLILLFSPGLFRLLLRLNFPGKNKIEKPLNRTVDAVTVYSHRKGSLVMAVVMGMVVYFFWFLTYYTNSLAMGAGLTLSEVFKVGPMTQIATMIPLSIAGIGLREGAFMGLLDSLGVLKNADSVQRTAMMLSATMVYFVSISVNIIGAVIFLTRKTDYQRQMAEMKQART